MDRLTKRVGDKVVDVSNKYFNLTHEELVHELFNKLADYEDLEEQGLLLKTPCKLKDYVYQIVKCSDNINRIFKMKVCNVCEYGSFYNGLKNKFVWNIYLEDEEGFGYSYATFYDFNKSVFLTREQAELKLKEMCE